MSFNDTPPDSAEEDGSSNVTLLARFSSDTLSATCGCVAATLAADLGIGGFPAGDLTICGFAISSLTVFDTGCVVVVSAPALAGGGLSGISVGPVWSCCSG